MTLAGVAWELDAPDLSVGLVRVTDVTLAPADAAVDRELADVLDRRAAGSLPPEAVRAAVRDMLRHGRFKPTGRSKPASEYLAGAADRGEFPRINNVVDVANSVSLASGLPISLLDLDLALGEAPGLVMRFGRPGEAYVFNQAGHEIDLTDLACLARAGGDCVGNPIKDALAAKTRPDTRDVVAVVYTPRSAVSAAALAALLHDFAARLVRHAGGSAAVGRLPGGDDGSG